MKVKNIDISNIGGVKRAFIEFDPYMNIICGPNGIGKTTILDSIAHCFIHSGHSLLKKHIQSDAGLVKLNIDSNDEIKEFNGNLTNISPIDNGYFIGLQDLGREVIYLNINRYFGYVQLNNIAQDEVRNAHHINNLLVNGTNYNDMKNWFSKRCLFVNTPHALTENNKRNLALAQRCFSLLNSNFEYSRVDAKNFDIFVSTPNGEIWYEYLSSGFKSSLCILFGIIKEIELRMPDNECLAESFKGVVLIDELEMHLHPEWQSRIVTVLRQTFPTTQFVVTTHSPHIVQNAEPNQIIALGADESGYTVIRELPNQEFGYTGWTVDEVLTDVMGMQDTVSQKFKAMIGEFDHAIDNDNAVEAKKIYADLDRALHPSSALRKMLRIDLASVSEASE